MKRFETKEEAIEWWNNWAQRLCDEGNPFGYLDAASDDEDMFEAMRKDGYDPESAKKFL